MMAQVSPVTGYHRNSRSLRSDRHIFSRDWNWEMFSFYEYDTHYLIFGCKLTMTLGVWPGCVNHTCWPGEEVLSGLRE